MAFKKNRNMKVHGTSGYRYKATPTIMLKGEWLKERKRFLKQRL